MKATLLSSVALLALEMRHGLMHFEGGSSDTPDGWIEMRSIAAVILLLAFAAWGAYHLLWAYQSASFSVAAEPTLRAVYETRAMVALPIGIGLVAIGVLFFLGLQRRKSE